MKLFFLWCYLQNNSNPCSCLDASAPPSWKTQDETPRARDGKMQNLSNAAEEKAALWFCRTTRHRHLSLEIQLRQHARHVSLFTGIQRLFQALWCITFFSPQDVRNCRTRRRTMERTRWGRKREGEKHEFTLRKQGRIFRGTEQGDFSCATSKQNVSDSYKVFLTAVDRTIFLPKSTVWGGNMTCLERYHGLFCFISTGPLSSLEIVNVKMP